MKGKEICLILDSFLILWIYFFLIMLFFDLEYIFREKLFWEILEIFPNLLVSRERERCVSRDRLDVYSLIIAAFEDSHV